MSRFSFVAACVCVSALMGCEPRESPVDPLEEVESAVFPALAAQKTPGKVVGSVTGSGLIDADPTSKVYLRGFTIAAVGREDGSAKGQWNLVVGPHDVAVHGEITCASFSGNSAYVGGTWDRSTFDDEFDESITGVAIELIDNGVNDEGSPDLISSVFYFQGAPGGAEAWCDDPVPGLVMPITQGNITVR